MAHSLCYGSTDVPVCLAIASGSAVCLTGCNGCLAGSNRQSKSNGSNGRSYGCLVWYVWSRLSRLLD